MVEQIDQNRFLSVAEDGSAQVFSVSERRDYSQLSNFRLQINSISHSQAKYNAKKKWIVALGCDGNGNKSIEIRDLNGTQILLESLQDNKSVSTFTINQQATQLAICFHPPISYIYQRQAPEIQIYDINTKTFQRTLKYQPSYIVDQLAYSPNGNQLILSGGDNWELVTWDFNQKKITSTISSPGVTPWKVALSKNGKQVGIRTEREKKPTGFNEIGKGSYCVFDLTKQNWSNPLQEKSFNEEFNKEIVTSLESVDGWKLVATPKGKNPWKIVHSSGIEHSLVIDKIQYVHELCYTFLKKTEQHPTRIAIGHRWGASVYSLYSDSLILSRVCVGHADDVVSITASADGSMLITGSRDQTVCAFSLKDWKFQTELGVDMTFNNGSTIVKNVAKGSPGWQAGLIVGDEILYLEEFGQPITKNTQQWKNKLQFPQAGKLLYFEVRRAGTPKPVRLLTTIRQRPIWRLFSTKEKEWVLWSWHDHYYATSQKGDSYIGWQMNRMKMSDTPTFFKAEKFKKRFYNPKKMQQLISQMIPLSEKVSFAKILPPEVSLTTSQADVQHSLDINISTTARNDNPSGENLEVNLWVNDYKYQTWLNQNY